MEGASGISHRTVEVNGIRMHVAEKGEGPPVLLLHGFPELWYTWRHQIAGLAARGYRAIAPDLRGYGDTDAPPDVASYTVFHLVGDLVALLDTLALSQVFVVGHDWGAFVAWHLCMLRPDRVKALVNLSVPFMSRNPAAKPLDRVRASYGDEYYIIRFQKQNLLGLELRRYSGNFSHIAIQGLFSCLRKAGVHLTSRFHCLSGSQKRTSTISQANLKSLVLLGRSITTDVLT
uniref:Bifunctional epoxide hydrolase 2 isoform X2 n=1 Tax=Elaeis guineensis var. tenera TaxID=51953 RepID=A0A8N4EWG3_ELAGV|nr:bifunctional epoxide hydrolase 2 isoform X2 [Elaeis guineensis]